MLGALASRSSDAEIRGADVVFCFLLDVDDDIRVFFDWLPALLEKQKLYEANL